MSGLNEVRLERLKKLAILKSKGIDAYLRVRIERTVFLMRSSHSKRLNEKVR